jgi:hypothetical protein
VLPSSAIAEIKLRPSLAIPILASLTFFAISSSLFTLFSKAFACAICNASKASASSCSCAAISALIALILLFNSICLVALSAFIFANAISFSASASKSSSPLLLNPAPF